MPQETLYSMLINLKACAAKNKQRMIFEVSERLPEQLASPCSVNCEFELVPLERYYLMKFTLDSKLLVTCQRCLSEFSFHYVNHNELALCDSEERAEQMMSDYECIVAETQIDLLQIITDDLHLYTPMFHLEIKDCDHEIDVFINTKLG
jgi:uncharacterized protein